MCYFFLHKWHWLTFKYLREVNERTIIAFFYSCASEIPLLTEIYGSDVLAFCVMHKHVAGPRGSMRQQDDHCSGEKVVQTTLCQTLKIKPGTGRIWQKLFCLFGLISCTQKWLFSSEQPLNQSTIFVIYTCSKYWQTIFIWIIVTISVTCLTWCYGVESF